MTELCFQLTLRKEGGSLRTSISLLNPSAAADFGAWHGLPETIHALLHSALHLEGRMQLLQLQEEGKERPTLEELQKSVLQMIRTQAEILAAEVLSLCLDEHQRIQES